LTQHTWASIVGLTELPELDGPLGCLHYGHSALCVSPPPLIPRSVIVWTINSVVYPYVMYTDVNHARWTRSSIQAAKVNRVGTYSFQKEPDRDLSSALMRSPLSLSDTSASQTRFDSTRMRETPKHNKGWLVRAAPSAIREREKPGPVELLTASLTQSPSRRGLLPSRTLISRLLQLAHLGPAHLPHTRNTALGEDMYVIVTLTEVSHGTCV
jgi:hypothetical protein